MSHTVFVYGTLKRGFPNAHVGMPRATFIGNYRTAERFPLVISGRWRTPNLLNEAGTGQQVTGEVYEVSNYVLTELDLLESVHRANGYRRLMVAIEPLDKNAHELTEAWTYLRERKHAGEIHEGPMATYPLEAGYIAPAKRWRYVPRPKFTRLKRLRTRLRRA